MKRFGFGKGALKGGGFSWSSYWATRSEVLFFGEISKISGGRLYNQKVGATDYLTVGGTAGSYTFQCPNTAAYIAADTEDVWFYYNNIIKTVTESILVSYDFTRTIVKYQDNSPYSIEAIMILSSDLDTSRMRSDFHLSVWWDDTLSFYGNVKGNRTVGRSVLQIIDADGNVYHEVKIGTQVWLLENLKTTKYNDNTPITLETNNTNWKNKTTEAYCWYNNDSNTYKSVYGAMYNGYAIDSGKLNITGYHIPTGTEYATLITYLGGASVAGGHLKESGTSHWSSPNTGADNSSGFAAVPGGIRSSTTGAFSSIGTYGSYWGSNDSASNKYRMYVAYDSAATVNDFSSKKFGFSVRLIKD